jgi:Protein of unknown function (DUF3307).
MAIDLVFVVLLIGHVLGDFYLQTNSVADKKNTSQKHFNLHMLLYTLCMAAVLITGIAYSINLLCLWIFASIFHFLIDYSKRKAPNTIHNTALEINIRNHSFIIDQLLHLLSLAGVWAIWGTTLEVRPFFRLNMVDFPGRPLCLILCFLCILRPVGILIGKGELWDFKKHNLQSEQTVQNAGRMIGYLERLIVMFFLIYQQFGAIAFILTAKSVARFKEIENDKNMAEYYLIGTLLSVVSVVVLTFLLGLCGGIAD